MTGSLDPGGFVRRLIARVAGDTLYRNSLALMLNTAVLSGLGFVFWTVAARTTPAADVGVVTTSISACTLLSTFGSLGLPNVLVRFQPARATRSLELCITSVLATQAATLLVLAATWWSPLRLPLAARASWTSVACAVLLLQLTTLGAVLDACALAARKAPLILVKNSVGGAVRLGLLLVPAPAAVSSVVRLAAVQIAGILVSLILCALGLRRGVLQGSWRPRPGALEGLWRFTLANHAAMVVGIMPLTVTPLVVLHVRGPREAAYCGVALMLLGLLSVIPSATAQSLFAESGHGAGVGARFRDAARSLTWLLVPAVAVTWVLAPLVFSIFGHPYLAAVPLLRWMALGALPGGVNYLVDAYVNGRADGGGYLFLNIENFVLVLVFVVLGAQHSLGAVGMGWCAGQALSAVVGVGYVMISRRRPVRGQVGAPVRARRGRHATAGRARSAPVAATSTAATPGAARPAAVPTAAAQQVAVPTVAAQPIAVSPLPLAPGGIP